jgi:hypothetical protein
MQSVTADDVMKAALSQVKEIAEVRDANGTMLGFFAPTSLKNAALYAHAAANIDPAWVRTQKRTPEKTYTTQEVLAHLRTLENG